MYIHNIHYTSPFKTVCLKVWELCQLENWSWSVIKLAAWAAQSPVFQLLVALHLGGYNFDESLLKKFVQHRIMASRPQIQPCLVQLFHQMTPRCPSHQESLAGRVHDVCGRSPFSSSPCIAGLLLGYHNMQVYVICHTVDMMVWHYFIINTQQHYCEFSYRKIVYQHSQGASCFAPHWWCFWQS